MNLRYCDAEGGDEERIMLPPGQQLVARDKWPSVGERLPKNVPEPWIVRVAGLVAKPQDFTLTDLKNIGWVEQVVDIHCVTRWSKPGVRIGGVSLKSLLEVVAPLPTSHFISFIAHSERRHSTSLPLAEAISLGSLLAFEAEGHPLAIEHGGPLRVVVPGRYFYKSLKWLADIELLAEDRLGYWEGVAGYHNEGDPWREQRYVAEGLSKQQAEAILQNRDISGRELRNLTAAGLDLSAMKAAGAILRNADFRRANLSNVSFDGANLSNAQFEDANLTAVSFIGADVEGADFAGSDLRGANFSGASLTGVSFCKPFDISAGGEYSFSHGAIIDRTTRIDDKSIEFLTPGQAAYLRSL
jgi:DMSO/TMAO reductase YedYZ molybdopterin-dependent catalytic subunit